MNQVQAVPVVSPVVRVARLVKERTPLGGGWIVQIAVPKDAHLVEFVEEHSDKKVCFARFAQNVKGVEINGVRKGGRIYFHVHHAEPMQFVGKKVTATAEVFQKEMNDDGSKYLYVDLKPVLEDVSPTHRLSAMGCKAMDIEVQEGFIMFETPAPIIGTIVVAPVGSSIVIKKAATTAGVKIALVQNAKKHEPKLKAVTSTVVLIPPVVPTEGPELERLLKMKGWKVGHRSGKSKH